MEISSALLDSVRLTIAEYCLLEPGEEIILAFSGGKDSLSLMLCLGELGYRVRPVAVDMGYDRDWADRIRRSGAAAGFAVEVIDIRAGLPRVIPARHS